MRTRTGPASRADPERIADTQLEIKELSEAWARRHRMRRGTPEYVDALETEERLMTHIWRRLRAERLPRSRAPTGD